MQLVAIAFDKQLWQISIQMQRSFLLPPLAFLTLFQMSGVLKIHGDHQGLSSWMIQSVRCEGIMLE